MGLQKPVSVFELSEKSKNYILISFQILNPNLNLTLYIYNQVHLHFASCYTNLIFLVQNILDPINVIDNSSINSCTPNCTTLVTPWHNAKKFPVLLPRQLAHEWTPWIKLQGEGYKVTHGWVYPWIKLQGEGYKFTHGWVDPWIKLQGEGYKATHGWLDPLNHPAMRRLQSYTWMSGPPESNCKEKVTKLHMDEWTPWITLQWEGYKATHGFIIHNIWDYIWILLETSVKSDYIL